MAEPQNPLEGQATGKTSLSLRDRLMQFIPKRLHRTNQSHIVAPAQVLPIHPQNPPEDLSSVPAGTETDPIIVDTPQVVEIPTRPTGLITSLDTQLQFKILVPESTERSLGNAAIIVSNESLAEGFFEAVQSRNPDGYIVGVGVGNIFTMLHCFKEGVVPKGMILSDIDSEAVAVGKIMIDKLKQATSPEDFENKFFKMDFYEFKNEIENIIRSGRGYGGLGRALLPLLSNDEARLRQTWEKLNNRLPVKWAENRSYKYDGRYIDTKGAILDRFSTLKQLAMEDNIGIFYADFTNQQFVDEVRKLPGFNDSTNLIYLSNIADHITNRGYQLANIKVFENLKPYQNGSRRPVFIDTLANKLNYYLRASHTIPTFTPEDFSYTEDTYYRRKPTSNLLFADLIA